MGQASCCSFLVMLVGLLGFLFPLKPLCGTLRHQNMRLPRRCCKYSGGDDKKGTLTVWTGYSRISLMIVIAIFLLLLAFMPSSIVSINMCMLAPRKVFLIVSNIIFEI